MRSFQVWKVVKPAMARTVFLSTTARTPPALARLPERIATCQMGSFSHHSYTKYFLNT
jgi:hypothetical protein